MRKVMVISRAAMDALGSAKAGIDSAIDDAESGLVVTSMEKIVDVLNDLTNYMELVVPELKKRWPDSGDERT